VGQVAGVKGTSIKIIGGKVDKNSHYKNQYGGYSRKQK
jgi:hypothetical protein